MFLVALAEALAGTAREDKCSNARPDKRKTDDQLLHSEFPLSESSPTGFAIPGEVNAPLIPNCLGSVEALPIRPSRALNTGLSSNSSTGATLRAPVTLPTPSGGSRDVLGSTSHVREFRILQAGLVELRRPDDRAGDRGTRCPGDRK